MKTLDIRIDTSTNEATNYQGETYKAEVNRRIGKELSVVNGDVALIAAHFQERDLSGVLGNLDLTGALALRVSLIASRTTGATVLSFQDVFNQGDLTINEILSEGKVTWQLDHPAATLDAILGTDESVGLWYEFTWLTPSDLPQTLGQIPVKLYAQGDIGAAGSPPPSEPVYMTSATALATFVLNDDYLEAQNVSGDTILTDEAGWKRVRVDTDTAGADVTITLPPSSTTSEKCVYEIINLGSTFKVIIAPDTTDEINGVNANVDVVDQFSSMICENTTASVTQTDWLVSDVVIP
jgi:hypothetical protein